MLNVLDRFADALGWWLIEWSLTFILFLIIYSVFEARRKE